MASLSAWLPFISMSGVIAYVQSKDNRFMKVIEKNIVNGKTAERIEQTAENRIGTRGDKPLEIECAIKARAAGRS